MKEGLLHRDTDRSVLVADEPSSFEEINVYADSKGYQNLVAYFRTGNDLLTMGKRIEDAGLEPLDVHWSLPVSFVVDEEATRRLNESVEAKRKALRVYQGDK